MNKLCRSLNSSIVSCSILLLITFFIYGNTLKNQLFFDDEELIYKNAFTQNLKYIPQYFTTNMVAGAGKVSNMYRPILITSFALDHALWGNTPLGYHLTNILLHAINGILIFVLMQILLRNSRISFLTSLLFIIHPIQTEAIAYASGRTDPLSTMWILASIITFFKAAEKKNSILLYICSTGFFVCAVLSKETAIVTPFILLLCLYLKKLKPYVYIYSIPLFGISLIYVVTRLTLLNFSNSLNFYQTQTPYSNDVFIRIWTFFYVLLQYFWLIFFPKDLVYGHMVPDITSPINIWILGSMLICLFIFYFSIKSSKKYPWVLFGWGWFFLFLLPSSGIIPINSIMQEHYLYLPSIGFFFLIACLCEEVRRGNLYNKYLLIIVGIIICIPLSIRTGIRNADWHDPITFYSTDSNFSNDSLIMKNNLAMEYANKGDLTQAIEQYKTIITIADVYPNTHHNLANAYVTLGKYKEAESEYKKALAIDPNFTFSSIALENLYKNHNLSP
jgi:tetratricopeptide (TPR) repeat protein